VKPVAFAACAFALTALGVSYSNAAEVAAKASASHASSKGRDWTHVVRPTPEGGFVMGNPNAKVELIEYGSMTCSHCREFDEMGVSHLLDDYVKSGKVSWEFRNYVRDAFDLTAALIARCDGAKEFFPLTRALFKDQDKWIAKVQAAPKDQLDATGNLPPKQRFVALAGFAGFPEWAATRGEPSSKTTQCLTDQQSIDGLLQETGNVTNRYPGFIGTPAFIVDGTLVDFGPITADQVWPTLRGKLDAALRGGGRSGRGKAGR
jgi:protein-disulfide isomerase